MFGMPIMKNLSSGRQQKKRWSNKTQTTPPNNLISYYTSILILSTHRLCTYNVTGSSTSDVFENCNLALLSDSSLSNDHESANPKSTLDNSTIMIIAWGDSANVTSIPASVKRCVNSESTLVRNIAALCPLNCDSEVHVKSSVCFKRNSPTCTFLLDS